MSAEKDIKRAPVGAVPMWAWKLSLAVCAAIWGGSFVVMKDTLDNIPPAWLMGIRFAASAVIVGALFWRKLRDNLDRSHLVMGAILGIASGAAFVVQNIGLDDTTPGRNAFLTATYCVMTPFINWLIVHQRPGRNNVVAALLAIACLAAGLHFLMPALQSNLPFLAFNISRTALYGTFGLLLLVGILIGFFGSAIAMRRYLKV